MSGSLTVGVLPLSLSPLFAFTPTSGLTLTNWLAVGSFAISATGFGMLVWASIALVVLIFLYLVRALAADRQSG